MPDERENNKNRVGTVLLSAEQEGDHILLTIQDDGHGMDPNVCAAKRWKKGMMDQDAADRLTEKDTKPDFCARIFDQRANLRCVRPWRGYGRSKTKIAQLNGTVNIESKLGVGTSIRIKVPLTLAIMPTLMVMLKPKLSPSPW